MPDPSTVMAVAEFAPDMPDVPSQTSDNVLNVVPATPVSYGPLPSLQPYATALTARCQGALSISDASGNIRVFSGDASKLYRITPASLTPADVSGAPYSTPADGQWAFTLFGTRVVATNYVDPIQSYDDGTSATFAPLITSGLTTLKAKYVATVMDWVVFLNTVDATYGTRPQRTHWSAINDPTNFPTPGTQQAANGMSDFQDIVGPHGRGMGIAGNLGTSAAGIFFERAVYRMIFAGGQDIFDFVPAEGARGLLAPGGLTQQGPIAFYWGEDGIKAFDGSNSREIGKNKVDKFLFTDLQTNYLDRITSAVDSQRSLIMWAYPGVGAVNGVANRLLIYSPVLDRFTVTDYNAVTPQVLVRGATFGRTLEDLDAFGSLDSLPFGLDSGAWAGGRSVLAAFDANNQFGYFSGPNLAPTVDTTDMELEIGRQGLLNWVRPLCDNPGIMVSGAVRDKIQDAVVYGAALGITPDGLVPMDQRGRYHRIRMQLASGASWSHISGVDVEDVEDMGLV